MLDRAEPLLKAAVAVLGAVLVFQLVGLTRRASPLQRTQVPEPASWAPSTPTNAPGAPGASAPGAPPARAVPMPMPMAAGPGRPGRPGRPGPGGGGPGGGVPLAPEVQARLDRVVQSELLGMIMRPPPMALLGIVGSDVLLRAPNGMSGLVREGGELGGVQIVRIGTNRVLVKENGEEKELTIFNGMGGESLLSKPKEGKP